MIFIYSLLGTAMLSMTFAIFELSFGIRRIQPYYSTKISDSLKISLNNNKLSERIILNILKNHSDKIDNSKEACVKIVSGITNDSANFPGTDEEHQDLYEILKDYEELISYRLHNTQPSQENTCALYSGNHRLIFINSPTTDTPVTFYSCILKGTEKCLFEYSL